MSEVIVHDILQQIQQLPIEDRLLLEERLSELIEVEWQQEVEQARRLAHVKNIDQETIDKAVHRVRYGS